MGQMSTAGRPPRAFISYASDDKQRFVLEFASHLLTNGVQVWLDKWELGGGDSLPQRIFDRGIGQSDAVLCVLSDVALAKPWVREEFDVAVVRRIAGKTRLIPILLDNDLNVPVAIEHLFHYNVPRQGFDYVAAEVVRDMFNVSRRPPLGRPPPFVGSLPNVRQLDDPIDTAVFAALIEHFRRLDSPNWITFSNSIGEAVEPLGISYEQVLDSIEILERQHLVNAQKMLGPRWQLKGIPDYVWLEEEARGGLDVDALRRKMLSDIVNEPTGPKPTDWYDYRGIHWRTVTAILNEFSRAGYIAVSTTREFRTYGTSRRSRGVHSARWSRRSSGRN
ncbi:MAG: Toll-Interleukin receptor [Frankiales bacterium]|nr:Toll-Interleukin receptor [Frankiales bacterium]